MSEAILSVRNLRVVFPHRHGVLVPIDDISFDCLLYTSDAADE